MYYVPETCSDASGTGGASPAPSTCAGGAAAACVQTPAGNAGVGSGGLKRLGDLKKAKASAESISELIAAGGSSSRQAAQYSPPQTDPAPPEFAARTPGLSRPLPTSTAWRSVLRELKSRVDHSMAKRLYVYFCNRYHDDLKEIETLTETIKQTVCQIRLSEAETGESWSPRAIRNRARLRELKLTMINAENEAKRATLDANGVVRLVCPAISAAARGTEQMETAIRRIADDLSSAIESEKAPRCLRDAISEFNEAANEIVARKSYLTQLLMREFKNSRAKDGISAEVKVYEMEKVLLAFELCPEGTGFRPAAEEINFRDSVSEFDDAVSELSSDLGSEATSVAGSIDTRGHQSLTPARGRVHAGIVAERKSRAGARLRQILPACSETTDNARAARVAPNHAAAADVAARALATLKARARPAKPTPAVAADLRADKSSATEVRSSARLFGCDAAARVMSGGVLSNMPNANTCPTGIRFPGEELRLSYANYLRSFLGAKSQATGENADANAGGDGAADEEMPTHMFEHGNASSATYSLYSGVMATVPVGDTRSAASDVVVASEVEKIFNKQSVFDTHAAQQMAPMLLPLVSADRMRIGGPEWMDIGRVLATTYAKTSLGDEIARAAWIDFSAQKVFLSRAREWIANESGNLFPSSIRGDCLHMPDRLFEQWAFGTHAGSALSVLRSDEPMPLQIIDSFDFLYSPAVSREATPTAMLREVARNPFASRNYANLYAHFSEVCELPRPSGGAFAAVVEDYVAFRDEYKAAMRSVHGSVTRAFTAGAVDIVGHARSFAAEIREASGSGPISAALVTAKAALDSAFNRIVGDTWGAKSSDSENPVRKAIAETASSSAEHDVDTIAAVGGATRVRTFTSPEDFEWGISHENNCALMFIHLIRESGLARRQSALRAERDRRILTNYAEISKVLATGLATSGDVGRFMAALAHVRAREDVSAAVGMAIDVIAKNEILNSAAAAWKRFRGEPFGRITVRTLGAYAASDSPRDFSAWQSKWAHEALHQAAISKDTQEKHVGAFAARILWLKYICVPSASLTGASSGQWYRLDPGRHYLRKISGTGELTTDISECVYDAYDSALREFAAAHRVASNKTKTLSSCGRANGNEEEFLKNAADSAMKIFKGLVKLERYFTSDRGHSAIMGAMRKIGVLTCPGMNEFVNEDPDLLAFENGVVDLKNADPEKIDFRAGKIEDYVTMTTRISMPYGGTIRRANRALSSVVDDEDGEFSETHPDVLDLDAYLAQVFPDAEERDYAIVDLASIFHGRNADRQFRVWIGKGANSKSLLAKIIQKMLGAYAFDLPVEAVATKQMRNASGPSPELAQGVGARVGFMSEPASSTELDSGIIKRFTGNERIFARNLHENGGSRDIMYKIILLCNDPPNLSDFDEASKNRMVFLPFMSKWSLSAPPDVDDQRRLNHYPMDPHFEKHVPRLARALAWKLFHAYPRYKSGGLLTRPAIVTDFINRYWRESDIYLGFQEDCLVPAATVAGVRDPAMLKVQDAYAAFQKWWAERNPGGGSRQPTFQLFRTNMVRKGRLGDFNVEKRGGMSGWTQWRLRATDADDE